MLYFAVTDRWTDGWADRISTKTSCFAILLRPGKYRIGRLCMIFPLLYFCLRMPLEVPNHFQTAGDFSIGTHTVLLEESFPLKSCHSLESLGTLLFHRVRFTQAYYSYTFTSYSFSKIKVLIFTTHAVCYLVIQNL